MTNYEDSILRILEQLSVDQTKSEDDLYQHFGEEVFTLSLGGATIELFLDAIAGEGYLKEIHDKYVLTHKGVSHRKELQEKQREMLEAEKITIITQNAFLKSPDQFMEQAARGHRFAIQDRNGVIGAKLGSVRSILEKTVEPV